MIKILLSKIVCVFVPHKRVMHYTFTEDYIYKYKCKRCGCMMGMPSIRMGKYPPPGTTSTHLIKDWGEYVTKLEEDGRERGITITYAYEKR